MWKGTMPCLAVEQVELERVRHERAQLRRPDRPVGEQQVMPRLRHHPRLVGHGPGTMCDVVHDRAVEVVLHDGSLLPGACPAGAGATSSSPAGFRRFFADSGSASVCAPPVFRSVGSSTVVVPG
jgi:hypothetical protein